jgi:membrane protease YdiL (CAAX protease family)
MGDSLRWLLKTEAGRLRLGWRLLAFAAIGGAVTTLAAMVLPAGRLTGSAALLTGSLVAGWVLLAGDGRRPGALGFYVARDAWSEVAGGIGAGLLIALAVIAGMVVFGGLRWTSQPGSVTGWLAGAVGALAFFALPAAAEEALLRGYPLQALAEVWGPAWALGATSLLFGVMHLNNPGVGLLSAANVMAAGLLLGVVYLKTGSLWWATGLHLAWNWAHGFVADVPVSGLELIDAPYYEGVVLGPEWLGGGSFGPEGSVVATLVVVAATVACWRASWLGPGKAAVASGPLALLGARA